MKNLLSLIEPSDVTKTKQMNNTKKVTDNKKVIRFSNTKEQKNLQHDEQSLPKILSKAISDQPPRPVSPPLRVPARTAPSKPNLKNEATSHQ